jgi:hypothetical protein
VIQILTLLLTLALPQAGPTDSDAQQETAKKSAPARPRVSKTSACEATGTAEIKIDCEYPVSNDTATGRQDQPRIVLSHAVVTFAPKHESHMMIQLTFTNESSVAFIGLWIPDPNPALKFDATHNFLLSNAGVDDPSSRLNQIATILVEKADKSDRSHDH